MRVAFWLSGITADDGFWCTVPWFRKFFEITLLILVSNHFGVMEDLGGRLRDTIALFYAADCRIVIRSLAGQFMFSRTLFLALT